MRSDLISETDKEPAFKHPLKAGTASGDAAFLKAASVVAKAEDHGRSVIAIGLWDGIAIIENEKRSRKEVH